MVVRILFLLLLLSVCPAEAFSIKRAVRAVVHPPIRLAHTILFHLEIATLGAEHYFRRDIGSLPALLHEEYEDGRSH